ncbi:Mu-like prophage host-nuclease inhibitor protein Gam [Pleomorphomonas diazotrophica]|uniref:host-nuclease inhibitor Gam family protein n=1 Tax=Pleomorphomonas diazotrophica TaxID=1166257 RepID=UPI0008E3EDB7|nr:host-nuclease inhibitor Gam family protein [Pleomorphomonas diazotrophica]SFM35749.1 Mu-like prophage host-nuclease inhibitor protein Gam [Pleomorphomonas diazotrophica]
MAKSARQTTRAANISVPQSREEATQSLSRYGLLQREIGRIQAGLDDKITALKEAAEAKSTPLQEEAAQIMEGLRIWSEANRAALTNDNKVKFVDLGTGKISWRLRPAKVTVRGTEAVLEALRRLGLGRFIRTSEEINKEAMLAEADVARTVPGITIGSAGEDFVIEPLTSPLSTGGADAAA